jgi:hypothetical protein
MRGMKKYLASTVLSAAALLFTGAANAMQIPQYDQMVQNDKSTYVTFLIMGAAKALERNQSRYIQDFR